VYCIHALIRDAAALYRRSMKSCSLDSFLHEEVKVFSSTPCGKSGNFFFGLVTGVDSFSKKELKEGYKRRYSY
jgi:hypothetical protein